MHNNLDYTFVAFRMVTCCVIGCNNRCTNIEKNSAEKITFHKIPKDEKRRKEWIRAVCRKDWEASARSAICSVHFRQEDIDRSSLVCVRLREGVIPSVFPTFPTYYQQTKLRDSTDVTGIKVEAVEIEDTHVDNLYPSGLEFVSCGVENSEEFKGEQCLARSIKSEESIVLRDNADIQGHNSCDPLQSGVVSGSVQSNSLSAADSSYTYSDDRKFTCNVCAEVFTQS